MLHNDDEHDKSKHHCILVQKDINIIVGILESNRYMKHQSIEQSNAAMKKITHSMILHKSIINKSIAAHIYKKTLMYLDILESKWKQ